MLTHTDPAVDLDVFSLTKADRIRHWVFRDWVCSHLRTVISTKQPSATWKRMITATCRCESHSKSDPILTQFVLVGGV
ncbi:hypothetical protein, partial [Nocardia sp. NPDC059239]|uniref:hypothetical protein n=1 Tax=Nocardia sp. NPDC059239 TaxID=3346785 RepID=UPI00368AA56B